MAPSTLLNGRSPILRSLVPIFQRAFSPSAYKVDRGGQDRTLGKVSQGCGCQSEKDWHIVSSFYHRCLSLGKRIDGLQDTQSAQGHNKPKECPFHLSHLPSCTFL